MFVFDPAKISARHKRCTYEKIGTVVDVQIYENNNDDAVSTYTYGPVYEFEMNGMKYRYTALRSFKKKPDIGEKHTLFVNPNNPEVFYNPEQDSDWLRSVRGIPG